MRWQTHFLFISSFLLSQKCKLHVRLNFNVHKSNCLKESCPVVASVVLAIKCWAFIVEFEQYISGVETVSISLLRTHIIKNELRKLDPSKTIKEILINSKPKWSYGCWRTLRILQFEVGWKDNPPTYKENENAFVATHQLYWKNSLLDNPKCLVSLRHCTITQLSFAPDLLAISSDYDTNNMNNIYETLQFKAEEIYYNVIHVWHWRQCRSSSIELEATNWCYRTWCYERIDRWNLVDGQRCIS